jgi:glucokinase
MPATPPPYRLGIDLGGTKILALVIGPDGRVIARAKRPTKADLGYVEVLDRIVGVATDACQEAGATLGRDLRGLGVGLPGPVDDHAGVIHGAVNLGWDERPVAADLAERFGGVRVVIGNDVNFGALGEVTYGAGRDAPSAYCFFVGTGLGGALVIDGQVINGRHGLCGEVGHLVTPFGDALCGCGQHGCLEAYASKTGMQRMIARHIKRGDTCLLEHTKKLRAADLRRAWDAGCRTTHTVIERATAALAWGVAVITCAVDPAVVLFGGGVMEEMADVLLKRVAHHYRDYVFVSRFGAPDLRPTRLGDDAVATGAAVAGGIRR